jgi:Legionella pneumophila major outer membrane protein precursor
MEADGLYLKAHEEGLSFALKNGDLKQPRFEWDFGFKLAFAHFFRDRWDAIIRLTLFHTHADSLLHAKSKTLYPLWITEPLAAEKIKMHWRLHLGLIDALVGKEIRASAHWLFHPQIGLRYVIARQKFNLNYFLPAIEEIVRMKNKFWGIGPYGSLGLQWLFAHSFSLCATGGLSIPYGEFYLHEDEELAKGAKIFGLRQTFARASLIADAQILLRWQKIWEKSRLSIQGGWDAFLLFKQNRLVQFFDDSPLDHPGNLGLSGWEWGFRFDF